MASVKDLTARLERAMDKAAALLAREDKVERKLKPLQARYAALEETWKASIEKEKKLRAAGKDDRAQRAKSDRAAGAQQKVGYQVKKLLEKLSPIAKDREKAQDVCKTLRGQQLNKVS